MREREATCRTRHLDEHASLARLIERVEQRIAREFGCRFEVGQVELAADHRRRPQRRVRGVGEAR